VVPVLLGRKDASFQILQSAPTADFFLQLRVDPLKGSGVLMLGEIELNELINAGTVF
jgi:hypothetical protein